MIRVAAALGGTISCRLLWHGEGLDRLLDAAHASLLDKTLSSLHTAGWQTATEVTFNVRGERGSIDILAFHEATGSLLVIEIKSVVPDLQGMLGTLDRKVRVAAEIARERGWVARPSHDCSSCPTTGRPVAVSISTGPPLRRHSRPARWRSDSGFRTLRTRWPASCFCQMTLTRSLVTESARRRRRQSQRHARIWSGTPSASVTDVHSGGHLPGTP